MGNSPFRNTKSLRDSSYDDGLAADTILAMSILPRLLAIYQDRGFAIRTGLNPAHFANHREAPFTVLWRGEEMLFGYGGLSLHEIMILEQVCALLDPRRIYIIGNAWGWSTVALALMAPRARIVAADPGEEVGAQLTERIATEENLDVTVLRGPSPEVTSQALRTVGGDAFDLVLIDGEHQNAAMIADFEGVLAHLDPRALVICHDVIQHNLVNGIQGLRTRHDALGTFMFLERTASGMAIFAKPATPPELIVYLACFRDPVAGLG